MSNQQRDKNEMSSSGFSFVHISDHHLFESETRYEYGFSTAYAFRQVIRHIAENVASEADFIVTTGDVAKTSSKETYKHIVKMLNANLSEKLQSGHLQISLEGLDNYPLYVLPGNLDDRDNFYRYLAPNISQKSPMNGVFTHKGVCFISLDWGSKAKARYMPVMSDFLKNELQTNQSNILLMHHHITPVGIPWIDEFIADDVGEFIGLISRYKNILAIICGHTHCTYETEVEGIPVYGIRSTAPQFVSQTEPLLCIKDPHYRLVRVDSGKITTETFTVPL